MIQLLTTSPTNDVAADGLTKPLSTVKFLYRLYWLVYH